MMKILYISTFYPLRGGIAHFNALLFDELQKRGHTLEAITFSRQYPKIFFPGKTQEELSAPTEQELLPKAKILLDSINPLSWLRVGLLAYEEAPDVVLFKYWIPFFAPAYFVISLLAKLRRNTKVVYILDNFKPHEKRFGDSLLLWLATRFTDGYIAMSDLVERDLQQSLPNVAYIKSPHPIYHIFGNPMPKADARKSLGLSEKNDVLLFFGYIRRYKGLDLLLDAMPDIISKRPNVKLIIAGEFYGDEAAYKEKISQLGIEAHLLLATDYIPTDEVTKYFSAADLAVLPYRSATQSGIVQIAYHFGLPALVTDVGGLSEVVIHKKTGIVVAPESPQALALGVEDFFAQRFFHNFHETIMQERVKYSWSHFAESFEKLARSLSSEIV